MFAIGMLRGRRGVHHLDVPAPQISQPDEVLVRVKEVGLDGTDFNVVRYGAPDIAEGSNEMVLGHEGVGVVEQVGSGVSSLAPGDIVAVTVRRGCGECQPCLHNQSDMCLTGRYKERGLHGLDGLLTSLVVEQEQYLAKVPVELARQAVFTEPLSIVEKGVEQIRTIQSRLPWFCGHEDHGFLSKNWGVCKVALVVGVGPLGLLATALLRLAKAHTYAADVLAGGSLKAHLAEEMGVEYIDSRTKTPEQMVTFCCSPTGQLDIIFDASGSADAALSLVPFMSRSSICIWAGIPREETTVEIDAAQLVRQIVRHNQVIVGSVNSNRRHFEMALKDMSDINREFPALLKQMVTHRFRLQDYRKAFALEDGDRIKAIIEVDPWR